MFSHFEVSRLSQEDWDFSAVKEVERDFDKFKTVFAKIKALPNVTEAERKFLDELEASLARAAGIIHQISKKKYAHQYEAKFHLVEEILDTIMANHKLDYAEVLNAAFSSFKRFENGVQFAAFAEMLIGQVKHMNMGIEPKQYQEYLTHLTGCLHAYFIFADSITTEAREDSQMETAAAGGADAYYDKHGKWPVHVVLESALEGINKIADKLVRIIRHGSMLNDFSSEKGSAHEKAIREFVLQHTGDECKPRKYDSLPYKNKIESHIESIIQHLLLVWENQFSQEICEKLTPIMDKVTPFPAVITTLTLAYLARSALRPVVVGPAPVAVAASPAMAEPVFGSEAAVPVVAASPAAAAAPVAESAANVEKTSEKSKERPGF